MKRCADTLYVIFIGLLMFLAGACIIGGVSYFVSMYFKYDFISILVYFFLAKFLAREVVKNIEHRKLYSVIIVIYCVLMFFLSDWVAIIINLCVAGIPILTGLGLMLQYWISSIMSLFIIDFNNLFASIITILLFIIKVLVCSVGCIDAYKQTK